jgi:hypothetical protein
LALVRTDTARLLLRGASRCVGLSVPPSLACAGCRRLYRRGAGAYTGDQSFRLATERAGEAEGLVSRSVRGGTSQSVAAAADMDDRAQLENVFYSLVNQFNVEKHAFLHKKFFAFLRGGAACVSKLLMR